MDDQICPVCLDVVVQPTKTCQYHVACRACIRGWKASDLFSSWEQFKGCPVCRRPLKCSPVIQDRSPDSEMRSPGLSSPELHEQQSLMQFFRLADMRMVRLCDDVIDFSLDDLDKKMVSPPFMVDGEKMRLTAHPVQGCLRINVHPARLSDRFLMVAAASGRTFTGDNDKVLQLPSGCVRVVVRLMRDKSHTIIGPVHMTHFRDAKSPVLYQRLKSITDFEGVRSMTASVTCTGKVLTAKLVSPVGRSMSQLFDFDGCRWRVLFNSTTDIKLCPESPSFIGRAYNMTIEISQSKFFKVTFELL